MDTATGNVLGLVELAENYSATDLHASASFNVLRDAFYDRLKTWVRPKDQWRSLNHNRVCVILKDIGSDGELELAAAKLRRVFQEPHRHFSLVMPFSVTAGFTRVSESSKRDMGLAMRQASIALSEAKRSATLYKVYSPRSGMNPDAEPQLLARIAAGMNAGEFVLYYQPKVHAGYKSLLGAEALIRWQRDGEIITPDEFIDVAERHDIIKPLTWWTIKSAVARLARWPESLSIAVNVSPVLLLEDDILSVVNDALDIYGVAPERLNLEVTERVMVENQAIMLRQLHRLREIGVKTSIDDFGTGFSSLSYFRDLPVDEIKIDQSFVRSMLESTKDHAIVKAVIDLAHNFDLKVVAEGVETIAIADRLAEMRCDILQGYAFDRPLAAEDFARRYRL